MTNGAHVAKPENVKSANSTKTCFNGFASSGSSLTEHHFIQSLPSAHVRLVFCFFVCLFASSEPPVSEPVCPRARTPCSRVVSCSSKGISWEKKGKQVVVTMVCEVWMIWYFRHVAPHKQNLLHRWHIYKDTRIWQQILGRSQTKLLGISDNQKLKWLFERKSNCTDKCNLTSW